MALDVNVVQLNQYLKRVIERIERIHVLVEIDKLLKICEDVEPSRIGKVSFFCLLHTLNFV